MLWLMGRRLAYCLNLMFKRHEFESCIFLQIVEHREQWSISAWEAVLQIFKVRKASEITASDS